MASSDYDAWKWDMSKEVLIHHTLADFGLCHSLLAFASAFHKNDIIASLRHETATLHYVAAKISNAPVESFDSLIWAVSRIAVSNVSEPYGKALISC
jgi:hypothetical protein